MVAVHVPPMSIAAFDSQMLNFPNIGCSIVKTYYFTALDLAKFETAVLKLHNFDQLADFNPELQLLNINNLCFVCPDHTHLQSIARITLEE